MALWTLRQTSVLEMEGRDKGGRLGKLYGIWISEFAERLERKKRKEGNEGEKDRNQDH